MRPMLTLIAMADAYGAGFEFARGSKMEKNTLSGYLEHNLDPVEAGRYSDDTQMSVAVAEALMGSEAPGALEFAEAFARAFHRDPRQAYARGFYEFLQSAPDGEAFLRGIRPDSDRSGAAMRACPVGLLGSVERVLEAAAIQARVTHDTPEGIASAQAVAAAVFHQRNLEGQAGALGLFEYLNHHVPGFEWGAPWSGRVSVSALDCARAAIWLAGTRRSYAQLLKDAVALGGDTDTVAAIAAGIASGSPNYEIDPPEWMEREAERGPYGLDFLRGLDERLALWSKSQAR